MPEILNKMLASGSSRVVLHKGKRKIVLRGMFHIAPESFYESLKREVREMRKKNALVVVEGLDLTIRGLPQKYAKIIRGLRLSIKLQRFIARASDNAQQNVAMLPVYNESDDDLRLEIIDLDAFSLAESLYARGVRFAATALVEKVWDRFNLKDIAKKLKSEDRSRDPTEIINLLVDYVVERSEGRVTNKTTLKILNRMLCEIRRRQALADNPMMSLRNTHIASVCDKRRLPLLYLQYGQGHVPGLLEEFVTRGWRVVRTTKNAI